VNEATDYQMGTDEYIHKELTEEKCVTDFTDTHYAQMIGYLAITGLRLAVLFNFKEAKLRWKRVIR
jgi:GxxExxY protein